VSPRRPSQKPVAYSVRIGDERILAPLAAFFPDMFGLHGDQLFHRSEKFVSDATDPNDDDYLERTMSRHELVCYWRQMYILLTYLVPLSLIYCGFLVTVNTWMGDLLDLNLY